MSKKIKFHCAYCGKEKEDWEYRHPRFCSKKCSFSYAAHLPKPWQVNRITLLCKFCGKEFSVSVSQKELRNSKFCSRACKGKEKSISMRGELNHNYSGGTTNFRGPNWESQARAARKRDGLKCQVCFRHGPTEKIKIEVHHIIPYRNFRNDWESANKLSNLISLCRQCHVKVERGKILCPQIN